jgi:hypothetical protein
MELAESPVGYGGKGWFSTLEPSSLLVSHDVVDKTHELPAGGVTFLPSASILQGWPMFANYLLPCGCGSHQSQLATSPSHVTTPHPTI